MLSCSKLFKVVQMLHVQGFNTSASLSVTGSRIQSSRFKCSLVLMFKVVQSSTYASRSKIQRFQVIIFNTNHHSSKLSPHGVLLVNSNVQKDYFLFPHFLFPHFPIFYFLSKSKIQMHRLKNSVHYYFCPTKCEITACPSSTNKLYSLSFAHPLLSR